MSGVAIVRTLLVANANLIAQVPAVKILAGVVPQETVLPAIALTEVDETERMTMAMDRPQTSILRRSRVQVTVLTKTYPTMKSILELVRRAVPHTRGLIAGCQVQAILPDSAGNDEQDVQAVIFYQTRDFIVSFFPGS